MVTKEIVRKECKLLRDDMDETVCSILSHRICERIIQSPRYQSSSHILLYASIKNEPDLTKVLVRSLELGKNVYLPRVEGTNMTFIKMNSLNECIEGAFHILEPQGSIEYVPSSESIVLVPGVAFQMNGSRIGYGKGFYDRYFNSHKMNLCKIGICYDKFLHYNWEASLDDVAMDVIITDQEEVLCDEFRGIM